MLKVGVSINYDDLTPEEAFYLEYYGLNAKAQEKNDDWEILAKMLSKCFGGK